MTERTPGPPSDAAAPTGSGASAPRRAADPLARRIAACIDELCAGFPDRHVGGPGNRAATAMAAERLAALGFDVTRTTFDCLDYEPGGVALEAEGERFEAYSGPYSPPCDVRAPLAGASVVDDLETEAIRGTIVLIHGELARGQLMPKNFTFYNPESHQRVYRALDEHAPAAVVAATGQDLQMVGSLYPFPLFEDGDLDIPNAYMRDVDGARLMAREGREVTLRIDSRREPSTGEHVVARLSGDAPGRVVVFAHIDSKKGSPGALDNATGVAALLGLAELLAERRKGRAAGPTAAPTTRQTVWPTVEIVPMNGEDDYANPGEMLWMAENERRFGDIILGVNIDDAGWLGHDTHVSFYDVPEGVDRVVRAAMAGRAGLAEGPRWFQSDHMLFGINGRPAIAVASSDLADFMAEACHTERDTPELADAHAVADIARFLDDVIERLGRPAS